LLFAREVMLRWIVSLRHFNTSMWIPAVSLHWMKRLCLSSRIISSSWIKKYNVTYYTTDKKSTYDVSMSTGGHLVHIWASELCLSYAARYVEVWWIMDIFNVCFVIQTLIYLQTTVLARRVGCTLNYRSSFSCVSCSEEPSRIYFQPVCDVVQLCYFFGLPRLGSDKIPLSRPPYVFFGQLCIVM